MMCDVVFKKKLVYDRQSAGLVNSSTLSVDSTIKSHEWKACLGLTVMQWMVITFCFIVIWVSRIKWELLLIIDF